MIVKLAPYNFSKDSKISIPMYIWKFTFELININDFNIIVIVCSHPKFSIKLGPGVNDLYVNHQSKDMVYKKNELVGVQHKLSKSLFDIKDIEAFKEYCNGDTF